MPSLLCPQPYDQDKELIVPVFSPSINSGTEFLSNLPNPEPIAANVTLLEEGQLPSFVFVVRSGIVKITSINRDGQESLLGLRSEGWWAGGALALLNVVSLVTITTVTPCTISSIPSAMFSQSLLQNQRMLRHFISSQCRELMVEQKHGMMQSCSASERLDYLQQETNHSVWKTVDPISIMRQVDIAKLLDISPEHLSRLLHKRKVRVKPQRAAPTPPSAPTKFFSVRPNVPMA